MVPANNETVGRRVAEARLRAGLTQADLARAAGIDRSALAKVENGSRRITALELARIAEETGERVEWFVAQPIPAIVSYRANSGTATTSSIDQAIERVADDVTFLQSLGFLTITSPEPATAPKDAPEAANLAAQARAALSIEAMGPVINLVGPLADFGLFAFSVKLGADAPDAATSALASGAVTVINSDRAVGRRRLALAHELGHYVLADPYTVDWRVGAWTDAERTEWLIDCFARAFLLPAGSLTQRWVALNENGSVRDAAVRIASEYRVDMSTLAARLSDLSLASGEDLSTVRAATTTKSDIIEYDLVKSYDLEGTTLPRAYERAVLGLYRAERISAVRAVELLHDTIDEDGLPTLPPVSESEIWKFAS